MFKGKLWKKLLITFLMLSTFVIIIINYPLKSWMKKSIQNKYLDNMKNSATKIADEYVRGLDEGDELTLPEFVTYLDSIQTFTSQSFVFVNNNGDVKASVGAVDLSGKNILESNPNLFDKNTYPSTTLSGLLPDKSLVYVFQVNFKHQKMGYEIVYVSSELIRNETDDMLFWANNVGILFIGIFFLTMMFYTIYYTRVLRALIKRTVSYADEKFDRGSKLMKFTDEHQELMNAIDFLGEKNEGLIEYQKNFVANISHDFRSPLTSIRGYTVAIKDGTIPYESLGKYLDIIIFETDRLTGLTQNLLQLSEFDNKAIKLDYRRIDICSLLKQSAATFEAICANKKIKMRLIFAEKEIFVHCDVSKIQQVIHNLIDNAIKFSNEEGMIVITVSENDTKVFISVKDNGIGIPENAVNHIWERFYKTDLSRGKDKKGTGLGLSITKQIINAHGEKIVVDSTVGEGTEFTFSLSKTAKN